MKTKIIIGNWLFSWIPLCYCGTDLLVAVAIVGYFGFSNWLMNRHKKQVLNAMDRFDKWTDKIFND